MANRRYGSMSRPVRTNTNLLRMPQPRGPVPWDVVDDSGEGLFWIGRAEEDGQSPIGPHGPYPSYGATLPVVTRAISLIADPMSYGRLRTRRFDLDNPAGTLVPEWVKWLIDPQLLRPDLRIGPSLIPAPQKVPRTVFWRKFIAQAIGWGRSFLYFLEAADGSPIPGTLRIISAPMVELNDNGRWQIDDYEFDDDGRRNGGRLIRLDNPHHPEGVFLAHPETFKIARKIDKYTGGTFNSGIPSGFLKVNTPNLTKAQADALKSVWMSAHGGDARSIAVLNATTDFQALSLSPVDSALAEVKRLAIADVAFAFAMAPETLSVTMGNSAMYSNVMAWFDAHRDFALSPWIGAFEGCLSQLLPANIDVEVNLDSYVQPKMNERFAGYRDGIESGVITTDEARALEGLSPLPPVVPKPPFVFSPEEQAANAQQQLAAITAAPAARPSEEPQAEGGPISA
jgi:HK97 family phage portal protein